MAANKFYLVALLFLIAFTAGWLLGAVTNNSNSEEIADQAGPPGAWLDPAELRVMVSRANQGDTRAMESLYNHYEFASGDSQEALRWQMELAKLGYVESRVYVLSRIIESTSIDPSASHEALTLCSSWLE